MTELLEVKRPESIRKTIDPYLVGLTHIGVGGPVPLLLYYVLHLDDSRE